MADLSEIREKMASEYLHAPRRAMMAQIALDAIDGGLKQLEALGQRFVLAPAPDPVVLIFPKAVYKDGMPYREVNSSDELKAALKDGWREHPTEKGPVGPRPNGHPEMKAKEAMPDPVLAHPMSAQLAAGQGEGYAGVSGAGYEYLKDEDQKAAPAKKTDHKAHAQAEAKTDAALKSERGYESEAEEQRLFEEDEAKKHDKPKPKPHGHR